MASVGTHVQGDSVQQQHFLRRLSFWTWVIAAMIAVWAISRGPGPRVGDGNVYYLLMFDWAKGLRPDATDRVGKHFDAYVCGRKNAQGFLTYADIKRYAPPLINQRGEFDFTCYWTFPALAAIFYWPLKFAGADVGLSFNLLHVGLMLAAVYAAGKRLGPFAALSVVLLVLFSPALWYIDKAHAEFFTIMTTTIAMICFLAEDYALATFWLAAAAAQNPPFALLALVALGIGWTRQRGAIFAARSCWQFRPC